MLVIIVIKKRKYLGISLLIDQFVRIIEDLYKKNIKMLLGNIKKDINLLKYSFCFQMGYIVLYKILVIFKLIKNFV